MDTPSKERLVGAIIFVSLIVLLVPEILSGPHHAASAGDTPATVPTRSYVIDLGNPTKPAGTAAAELPPPAPGAQQLPAVAPSIPPAPQDASPRVTEVAPIAGKPDASAKLAAARPVSPASSAPKVAPTAVREVWVAQLGSFSKAENAERLVTTLRAKGYRAFVSPVGAGSHVLHRVRVGPEGSREAAEALVSKLKRDNQPASVVSLP